MNSITCLIRSLEHLNQGNRIAKLANKISIALGNNNSPKFQFFLRFAILRITSQHQNFEETQALWLEFLAIQQFTGFSMRQTKFPFSIAEMDGFWEKLRVLEIDDDQIVMSGLEYLRCALLLESYQTASYEPIKPYSTNSSQFYGFIDHILDDVAEQKLRRL